MILLEARIIKIKSTLFITVKYKNIWNVYTLPPSQEKIIVQVRNRSKVGWKGMTSPYVFKFDMPT